MNTKIWNPSQQGWAGMLRAAARQLEHDGRSAVARPLIEALLDGGDVQTPLIDRADAHCLLSSIHLRQGAFEAAEEHARKAIELTEVCGDLEISSKALYALGEVHYLNGAWRGQDSLEEALDIHSKCLKLREQIGDLGAQAISLSRIGVIHERLGNDEEATACYRRSVSLSAEAGSDECGSRSLIHLGGAEEEEGNLSAALDYYERSVLASRPNHDARSLTFDLCNVASVLARLASDLRRARRLLEEAEAIAKSMEWKLAMVRIAQVWGDVEWADGNLADAKAQYEKAGWIADRYGFKGFERVLQDRLSRLADHEADVQGAS